MAVPGGDVPGLLRLSALGRGERIKNSLPGGLREMAAKGGSRPGRVSLLPSAADGMGAEAFLGGLGRKGEEAPCFPASSPFLCDGAGPSNLFFVVRCLCCSTGRTEISGCSLSFLLYNYHYQHFSH